MTENETALMKPEVMETSIVEQLTRGEVDMQVTTAKRYPRSITAFKQEAQSLALRTPEIARSCFYVLPRGGKTIEGPSIRLAEVVAGAWGNLRCETRVLGADETKITAQATCWDMQKNVLIRCETSRRITDKTGRRYRDDMIIMTGNAAAAIALRNAIFKVVPLAYVEELLKKCKQTALSEDGGIDKAKIRWIEYYNKAGVETSQVLELLDKKGIDDIDLADITILQGLYTALSEGQTTIEQTFGPAPLENGNQKFGFKAKSKTKSRPKETKKETKSAKVAKKPDECKADFEPADEALYVHKGQEQSQEPPPPTDDDAPWDKYK